MLHTSLTEVCWFFGDERTYRQVLYGLGWAGLGLIPTELRLVFDDMTVMMTSCSDAVTWDLSKLVFTCQIPCLWPYFAFTSSVLAG